jgi:hypothetical protein
VRIVPQAQKIEEEEKAVGVCSCAEIFCHRSAIAASDEVFQALLKRTKGKAEEKKKRAHKAKGAVLKPVKAVAKRPAAHVLGCSKCRYLLNGCGKCRPIGWKKR